MKSELARELMFEMMGFSHGFRIGRIESGEKFFRPVEVFIIFCLSRKKRLNVSEIKNIIGLAPSTTTQITDSLVKKNVIKREVSKTDRRVIEITLTDYGEELVKKSKEEFAQSFESVVEELGEDDAKELLRLISKTNKFLGNNIKNIKEELDD